MDLHALLGDLKRIVGNIEAHLTGDTADLAKTAERDATGLEHDAATAAAPVIAEAKADAEGLAAQAEADVADLTQTVVTPVAPVETPAPVESAPAEQAPADSTSTPAA